MYELDDGIAVTLNAALGHIKQAEALMASVVTELPSEDLSLVHRVAAAGSSLDRIAEMLESFMESPIVQLGTNETKLYHWKGMERANLELVTGGQLASARVDPTIHAGKVIISDLQMDVSNMHPSQAQAHILFWLEDVYEGERVVEWWLKDESVQRLIDKLEGRI